MKKLLISLLLAIMLLPAVANAQTHYTLQVGSGTQTSSYIPDYGYYNYSYSQTIYTAGEVGLDGEIDTISYQVNSGSLTRTLNIYMAEVSRTSFSSTADAVSEADFHLVFSGSVSWSAGWVTIALDSVFSYQDTGSLVIAVIDQTGTYNSSYPNFKGTQMSNTRSLYAYRDGSPYTLSTSMSSSSSFRPNIRLGISSFSLYCAQPSNVAVSGIHDDEATFSWHENGAATEWEVVVSDSVITDFSSVVGTSVYDTTYTEYGLGSNTQYYVYVRAVCTSTDFSGWTEATTFRSACSGSTPLPYSTGFEGLSTAQLPNCWLQVQSGSSSASTFPAAYAYAPNARNSSVYFEFESSTGQTEIAAMPVMDDINLLQFSFYASLMDANFTFEVGVMEDTTFVVVDTVALTAGSGGNWAGSYYPYTVYFSNYTGTGDRIAMRVTASGSYTLMMDDFVVDYVPNCVPPTNLVMDSASVDWIALSWQENGSASAWVVEYDTVPIADSLLGMNVANTVNVSGTPSTTLNGLDTATLYYIYVYADCGDYSSAISLTASTLAGLPAEMPYTCDFEQDGPNGWELLNGTQTNQWVVDSAVSNGGSRSLYISNDGGASNSYSNNSTSVVFAVRTMNFSTAGEYSYSYDWMASGESSWDYLRVALVPVTAELTPGSNSGFNNTSGVPSGGIALDGAYRLNGQTSWVNQSGTFMVTNPGTYKMVFFWRNDGSGGTNPPAAIDNISIAPNTCSAPYGLAIASVGSDWVTLNWHGPANASSYQIAYGAAGFTPNASTVGTDVYDTTYTLTSLSSDTLYSIYVRTNCGGDDYSNWVSFGSVMPGAYIMSNPVDTLRMCGVTVFDNGGPAGNYTSSADNTLVLISPSPDSTLNIWGTLNSESNWDYLYIYDGIGTSGTQLYYGSGQGINIGPFTSTTGALTIRFTSDASSNYAGYELHTHCVYLSGCPAPISMTADSVLGDTVWVSWNDTASTGSYEVAFGPTGFNPDTAVANVVTVIGDSSYMFTGLTMGMSYDFYVRSNCSYEESSWRGPATATPGYFYTMAATGTDTLRACGVTIFDNGGGNGDYSNNCNSTLILYPADNSSTLVLSGTIATESNYDFLYIYDGVGTNGTLRYQGSGSDSFSNIRTDEGVFTIQFTSDGSNVNDGIAINVLCEPLPDCASPNHLVASNIGVSSADLAWSERGTASSWIVEYDTVDFTPGTGAASYIINVNDTNTTLTGLSNGTLYYVYVAANCGNDTSSYTGTTFTTLAGLPATIPFSCDFEGTGSNGWDFVNGSENSQWMVGSAVNNGGSQALYISDNGSSNSYAGTAECYVFATRTISLPDSGSYVYSFDWKCQGESSFDFMRVALVPASTILTAGSYSGFDNGSAMPSGSIALDGGGRLNLHNTWQTQSGEFYLTTPGDYKWVFLWRNDGSVSNQPPAAIDNVYLAVNNCPVVQNVHASSAGVTYVDIDWVDVNTPISWQVEYGASGFSRGSGTLLNVTSHPVHISGLDTLSTYDFYVRPICSATDTGRWSDRTSVSTALCDNAVVATNSTVCNQSTQYFPAYSFYDYSYTEVIIDSADLVDLTDITAWAFKPQNTAAGSSYLDSCTVYMAHTTQSSLSSGFIQDTTTFVKVFTGNLSFSNNHWQTIMLDTVFTWDGHSNIVVAVNRRHGDYATSGYFDAFTASESKARYIYQDNTPYTVGSISGGTATSRVPIYRLISCGTVGCRKPVISSVTKDYHSATVTWSGEGNNYEVNIKETAAPNWPVTNLVVTGNSYTFNGLMPATNYEFRVRQDCSIDTLGYSDWVFGAVFTDSLPCLTPDSIHTTAVTNATATFDWNVNGNESMWDIHVWYGSYDSIYRVATRPATVSGFTAGITYNAAIRPVCGINMIEGDWSDTIQFTTTTCPDVTGLTTSNVTTNSVTLNWNSNPMALRWNIEYGPTGFTQGQGTQAVSNTNSYVVTGLSDGITYDFYVKAVCGDNWTSENWVGTSATTQEGTIPCDAPTGVSTAVADNSVTVNWTAGTGNISFELEYGPRGFIHGMGTTTNATSSPVVISNLDYETQYDIYVRAICEQNVVSPWSTVATFTTGERPSEDCDPVQNLTVTNVTETSADINWQPGASGEGWQVELTDETGSTVRDNVTSETHISLTGLVNCKNYTVKVRTVCEDNNYSAYVTASFRTLGCEGIEEVEGINCRIFPNPATSSTTISVTGVNGMVRIAVVDMNGRTVATETLECSADCEKTMEVDKLAQGAYFVRITAENTNMVKKLIVR